MTKQYGSPGPRSITPELCDSRTLARCSLLANALWPRLIVQADDQGRLHGDAHDVRGLCFPKMPRVTTKAIEAALEELSRQETILRYVVKDEPYIQINGWWEYQGYQRRAYPSRYPPPDGWKDLVYGQEGQPSTFAAARGESRHIAAERGKTPPRARPAAPPQSKPVTAHSGQPGSDAPQNGAKNGLTPLGKTFTELMAEANPKQRASA